MIKHDSYSTSFFKNPEKSTKFSENLKLDKVQLFEFTN